MTKNHLKEGSIGMIFSDCARLATGIFMLLFVINAVANEGEGEGDYFRIIDMVVKGQLEQAVSAAWKHSRSDEVDTIWRQRYEALACVLEMRSRHTVVIDTPGDSYYFVLMKRHLGRNPAPKTYDERVIGVVSTLVPGAGHAMLGRWNDARVAALLVWPFLLLCGWAWRRRMGPVTVFFGGITLWLWSGTIFSAISLAHRMNAEGYIDWWKGLWMASGLPGRPW